MAFLIKQITDSLVRLAGISSQLVPLLQTVAVIVALVVLGLMVWKGHSR
ncbi:hypothetical protein [Ralstonia pseudosolanacearum]|nr:hypothetical protein [Ralstonia pseudosolanacearum]